MNRMDERPDPKKMMDCRQKMEEKRKKRKRRCDNCEKQIDDSGWRENAIKPAKLCSGGKIKDSWRKPLWREQKSASRPLLFGTGASDLFCRRSINPFPALFNLYPSCLAKR